MNPPNNPPNNTPGGGSNTNDYQTLDEFVDQTIMALTNAQLPDIEPKLAARGIPRTLVQTMLGEAQTLQTLAQKQQQEYGEQYNATADYETARAAVDEDYKDDLALARLAFKKDKGARKALGLKGDRARSQGGYSQQGLLFYQNALANPAYVTALATRGITQADLQAREAAFTTLGALGQKQQKEIGDAQTATQGRDKAHDKLAKWMEEFYITARIALRRYPQLMEKLGMLQRA